MKSEFECGSGSWSVLFLDGEFCLDSDSAVGSIWLWPFRDGLPVAGIPVVRGHGGSLGHLRKWLTVEW